MLEWPMACTVTYSACSWMHLLSSLGGLGCGVSSFSFGGLGWLSSARHFRNEGNSSHVFFEEILGFRRLFFKGILFS